MNKLKTTCLALIASSAIPFAQAAVSISTTGTDVYTENFASLAQTGTGITWTDNSTVAGWYSNQATYETNNSAATVAGQVSYGGGASGGSINPDSDRALGSRYTAGVGSTIFGAAFTNNTGTTLDSFSISYSGEQWYHNTSDPDKLTFEYSLDATSLSTGTWTAVTGLDFTSTLSNAGAGTWVDGNANAITISDSVASLAWANGSNLWIRFTDTDAPNGADQGLAVDSFKLSVTPVPEPTTYAAILGVAVLGLSLYRRRKSMKS